MHIFFVVRQTLPAVGPRSIQLAHWMRYLSSANKLHVISQSELYGPGKSPVIRRSGAVKKVRRLGGNILRYLAPVSFRDSQIKPRLLDGFFKSFEAAGRPRDAVLVTVSKYDVNHQAGLEIKKRTGLPWAAFFSDPWTLSSYYPLTRLDVPYQAAAERQVLENADLLLFPNEELRDSFLGLYPKPPEKTAIVPPAFDPAHYPRQSARAPRPGEILIRHVGNFYARRQPFFLFKTFQQFKTAFPEKAKAFRFDLVGSLEPVSEDPDWGEWRNHFHLSPRVSYEEALRLMKEADVLLSIDAATPENTYRPSKLIEYVGARRPIWVITPPNSPAERFAQKIPGCVASLADDRESILAGLHKLHDLYAQTVPTGWTPPAEIYNSFHAQPIARHLESLLQTVVK